jgi:hypothetical protein
VEGSADRQSSEEFRRPRKQADDDQGAEHVPAVGPGRVAPDQRPRSRANGSPLEGTEAHDTTRSNTPSLGGRGTGAEAPVPPSVPGTPPALDGSPPAAPVLPDPSAAVAPTPVESAQAVDVPAPTESNLPAKPVLEKPQVSASAQSTNVTGATDEVASARFAPVVASTAASNVDMRTWQFEPVPLADGGEATPLVALNELNGTAKAAVPEFAPPLTETGFRPELGRAVLDRIRLHLRPDLQSATIELNPAELGRVQIKIAMQEGALTATFRAETAQAREILERQLPELRASLAAQGIEAENLEVELGSAPFDDHAASDARSDARQSAQRGGRRGFTLTPAALEVTRINRTTPLLDGSGIDTFA